MDEPGARALLAVAEEARAALVGLDVKAAFERLEQVHDELMQALEWLTDERRTDDAFRLAVALAPFWTATKRLEEGSGWFERVQGLPNGDDARRGRALFEAGMLAFWQGDDERSTDLHEQARELGRRANDPTVTALALGGLARVVLRAGDVDEARSLCHEALAVSERTDDRAGRSGALG